MPSARSRSASAPSAAPERPRDDDGLGTDGIAVAVVQPEAQVAPVVRRKLQRQHSDISRREDGTPATLPHATRSSEASMTTGFRKSAAGDLERDGVGEARPGTPIDHARRLSASPPSPGSRSEGGARSWPRPDRTRTAPCTGCVRRSRRSGRPGRQASSTSSGSASRPNPTVPRSVARSERRGGPARRAAGKGGNRQRESASHDSSFAKHEALRQKRDREKRDREPDDRADAVERAEVPEVVEKDLSDRQQQDAERAARAASTIA